MRQRGWPAELRHPLFVVGTGLYLLAALHKRHVVGSGPWWPPVLTAHLADVLALPLQLTVVLWLLRRVYFRRPAFVLPASWVVSTWLVYSVWFEGLLPQFDARATADWRDVVAYAVGGLLFWRWLNRPA